MVKDPATTFGWLLGRLPGQFCSLHRHIYCCDAEATEMVNFEAGHGKFPSHISVQKRPRRDPHRVGAFSNECNSTLSLEVHSK